MQLLHFEVMNGRPVLVEITDDDPGIERAGRVDEITLKASESLDEALDRVRVIAGAVVAKVGDWTSQSDELEVEFGVRLNATAGAVIAKTSIEGHFHVRMAWKKSRPQ